MKNYITPQGKQALKNELKKLLHEERPALVQVISWAASNGDRSENGDYIYGKRRLREIDRRIRFLTQRLEITEVIDPLTQPHDRVLFGATVRYTNESGEARTVTIVGQDEIDPRQGRVSWVSPIAKALLNARVGSVVQLQTPKNGPEELEITDINYL